MVIRRDSLSAQSSSSATLLAAARGISLTSKGCSVPLTSATLATLAGAAAGNPTPAGLPPVFPLNSLPQKEVIQEVWEKERKILLSRASNGTGDSVERLMAGYLAV